MNEIHYRRFSDALVRLSGDMETLKMLAGMAAEDAPPILLKIESAITDEDFDSVVKYAHSLKGLLSTFEVGEPVCDLQGLIDAARQQDAEIVHLSDQLSQPLLELIDEIEELSTS